LEYFQRLQKLVAKTETDSTSNRIRGELTIHGKWFSQAKHWNTYALLTSCLHFGLDIFNARPQYLDAAKDTTAFNFFNEYAGQKNPSKATGAFCILRDGLDAADTKRFPESKYGPLIAPEDRAAYESALASPKYSKGSSNNDDSEEGVGIEDATMRQSNLLAQYVSPERMNKILQEFAPYGAKKAKYTDEIESATTDDKEGDETYGTNNRRNKNPDRLNKRNPDRQRNPNKRNPDRERNTEKRNEKIRNEKAGTDKVKKSSNFQDKRESNMIINDIGVNLLPDNYSRYLTQFNPNSTSRGYWRVGPLDQPYGRFARGFDSENGMKEMFFTLHKRFYNSSEGKSSQVRIIYFDKGNGEWSLNYYNGSAKTEAYRVKCNNSGRWVVRTITLPNIHYAQKLENNTDLSIKYLNGDNTIFNSIEVIR
jgi:hypothetical protein